MPAANQALASRLAEWYELLHRHFKVAGLITLIVFMGAAAWISRLPNEYQAITTILVNPQRVPDKYVSSTVTTDSNERLNTLSQQVLSSSRLETIEREFNLYPELRAKLGHEQVLDTMRHHILIELKQSSGTGPSSFTITYSGSSPQTVARVANQLAASFIQWNLRDREAEALGTTDFLSKELHDTKTQLDGLEEQLRAYKLQHLGELPDQMPANMQTLSRLQVGLQANVDAQNRLDQEAFLLKESPESAPGASTGVPSPHQQLRAREAAAQQELAELRQRYTPAHPDLIKKEAEVKALHAQVLASAPASPLAAVPESGAAVRLEIIENERRRLAAEQGKIQGQIASYQGKVDASPIREQEVSQLLRDYDTAKEHYRSLLDKTYSAEMATELERRQEGESFTMLDAARVPDRPVRPNRLAYLSGALLFSLLLGVAVAVLREIFDNSIKTEEELHQALPGVLLLGSTPCFAIAQRERASWQIAAAQRRVNRGAQRSRADQRAAERRSAGL